LESFFFKNSLAVSRDFIFGILDYTKNNGENYIVLYKLNKALDTIKTVTYRPDPGLNYGSQTILVEDSLITIVGSQAGTDQKLKLFLAQYDVDLNPKWSQTISDFRTISTPGSFQGYYPYRLRRMGNSYFLTGRCLYIDHFVESYLVKTDLSGNKIWDKRYRYIDSNTVSFEILPLGHDSLIQVLLYRSRSRNGFGYNKMFMRILDSNGNTIDSTFFPDEEIGYEISNAFLDHQGNIYLAGYYLSNSGFRGLIWKLDKNMNTIWRRVYFYQNGDIEDNNWLYKIHPWSDGGLVATGVYYDRYLNPGPKSHYLWLLSVDSAGCLGGDCGSDIGYLEWALADENVSLYPNPAQEKITLKIPQSSSENSRAEVHIYSQNGSLAKSASLSFNKGEASLNILELNAGSYILEMRTENKLFVKRFMKN